MKDFGDPKAWTFERKSESAFNALDELELYKYQHKLATHKEALESFELGKDERGAEMQSQRNLLIRSIDQEIERVGNRLQEMTKGLEI